MSATHQIKSLLAAAGAHAHTHRVNAGSKKWPNESLSGVCMAAAAREMWWRWWWGTEPVQHAPMMPAFRKMQCVLLSRQPGELALLAGQARPEQGILTGQVTRQYAHTLRHPHSHVTPHQADR